MTRKLTLSALAAACAILFLTAASYAPSAKLALCACAGLFTAFAALNAGIRFGVLAWLAASALSMFLLPDKITCLCFALFLGLYPVIKAPVEKMKKPLAWGVKIAAVNAAAGLIYLISTLFFTLPEFPMAIPLVLLAINAVFVVYDIGLSRLLFWLRKRMTWLYNK